MAKTIAQIEKKKRETEKRKKLEKAILKIAAEMPDEAAGPKSTQPTTGDPIKAKP